MISELVIPAFLIGLFGAGHCAGMCGGIGAVLSFAMPNDAKVPRMILLVFYNLGRICSYTFMGLLAGWLSSNVESNLFQHSTFPFLRVVAAVMIILMGLYVSGWWRILSRLEQIGGFLWRHIQPLSARLLPIKSAQGAFSVGCLWGWLPCGLVYSALALALSFAQPLKSALAMFAFGLGTLPILLCVGVTGDKLKLLLQKTHVRAATGIFLIGFGFWTLFFALQHSNMNHRNSEHSQHHAH